MAPLAGLALDEAMTDSLVRMQFDSQTASYRARYPDARFAILERAGAPIGRLVLREAEAEAWIVDLALLPETRGHGMGTALMGGLLAWLSPRHAVVRCSVLCTNTPSLRMCARAGFVQEGESGPHLDHVWRRAEDAGG